MRLTIFFDRFDCVQNFAVQFPILRSIYRSDLIRAADQLLCSALVQIRQTKGCSNVFDPRMVRIHRRIT